MSFGRWSRKRSKAKKKAAPQLRGPALRKSLRRAPRLEPLEDRRLMAFTELGGEFRINSDASVAFEQRLAELREFPEFGPRFDETEPSNRSVAVDHDGDFVVVWTSYEDLNGNSEDGDGAGVFARVYDRNANLRTEIQVNAFAGHPEFTQGDQRNASVAMDADGDFVVVWQSDEQGPYDGSADIFARRFDPLGNALSPPFRVNSVTVGPQINPAVATDYFGNFVVAWESQSQDASFFNNVKAQRFSYEGVPLGSEFRVNVSNLPGVFSESNPSVAVAPNGAFMIAWEDRIRDFGSSFFGSEIDARLFDANGAPLTLPFEVDRPGGNPWSNQTDDDPRGSGMIDVGDARTQQRNPQVATDREGNFTITWESFQDNDVVTDDDVPDSWGIYMRRYHYDARPSLFTEDTVVNPVFTIEPDDEGPFLLSAWAGQQYNPSVALTADGTLFITYSGSGDLEDFGIPNGEPFDPTNSDIWLRGFNPASFIDVTDNDTGETILFPTGASGPGYTIFPSLLVNQSTVRGVQRHPTIAVEPDGDAIIVWDGFAFGLGIGDSHGIIAKRYNETVDAVGPLVTNVVSGGRRILDNMQVVDNVTQLTVTFDEQVFDDGNAGTNGVNEVTNRANWKLLKNGVEVLNAVRTVTFGLNPATGKWEAVLSLDGNGPQSGTPALPSGSYELVALKNIRDLATNPLASFGNLENGVGFSLKFDVVASIGGEGLVNTTVSGNQLTLPESPQHVATDATGASVVVWAGNGSGDSTGIFLQRYDKQGTKIGIEQLVNVGDYVAGEQTNPAVAVDSDGDFVVTWSSYGNPLDADWDVYAQRFNSLGQPQGATLRANTFTEGIQRYSTVTVDTQGDFVIAWQSYGQDGSGYGIYARRFNAAGVAIGDINEVQQLTIDGEPTEGTLTLQLIGDEIVGDQTFGPIDFTTANFGAVFAQRLENALRGPNALNPILDVKVESKGAYRYVITFIGRDGNKNFSQLIPSWNFIDGSETSAVVTTRADGEPGEFLINDTTVGNQMFPQLANDAEGKFVVTWTGFGQDGDSPFESNIYAKLYVSSELLAGPGTQNEVARGSLGGSDGLASGSIFAGPASGPIFDEFELGPTSPGKWGLAERGTGAVVTYSFMASGVMDSNNLEDGWTNVALDEFMPSGFEQEIRRAFDAWSNYANIQFVEVLDGGEPFGSPGPADIRIGGHVIDGAAAVLAHAFFPPENNAFAAGDLHFDVDEVWTIGTSGGGFDIFQVAAHEIGHAIGLGHTDVPNSLMNPFYNTSFIGPQLDDIAGAQFLYGVANSGAQTPEFRVNQTVSGNQQYSSVAMDLDGDFVVTWTSYGQDGVGNGYGAGENGENGVFARRFTSSGDPVPAQSFTLNFTSTDVPLNIADGTGFGVSEITVPGDFIVTDVNLTVNITHTRDSDVIVSLAGPDQDPLNGNLGVTMFGGIGGLGRNFSGTVLDDEAGVAIANGAAPFTGRFRPAGALSSFDGTRGQGDWKLVVADSAVGQIGTLTGWSLQISGTSPSGDEFLVNTFGKNNQQYSRVSMDADGDFTIAWESFQDDPSQLGIATSYGVYAQRYARNDLLSSGAFGRGGSIGGEFRVPTTIVGDQRYPGVGLDHNGNAMFVWSGNGLGDDLGVYARRLGVDNGADLAGPIVTDVRYEANELQVLTFSDNPTGGTFHLQIGTQTLGPITYSTDSAITAANIQAALRGPGITPIFDVAVTPPTQDQPGFSIRFKNKDGNIDLPTIKVINNQILSNTGPVTTAVAVENGLNVISISNNTAGGTFSLQVNGGTFGPIEYSANPATTATRIQDALRGTGPTPTYETEVTPETVGNIVKYAIRFTNTGGSQPVVQLTDIQLVSVLTALTVVDDGADQQVFEDAVIEGNVRQLVVRFNEEMYQGGGPTGPNSILNPANWVLARDGQTLTGAITKITFGLSQAATEMLGSASGKWEAVLFLDGSTTLTGVQSLADGDYTLTILPNVQDLARNALDGNYNGSPGGSFVRHFTIVQPIQAGDEFLVNIDDVTGTQSTGMEFADGSVVSGSQSVASDEDGHVVVVYTSRNSATNASGIYYELFEMQPDGTRTRLRRGRVDTGAQGRVENPSVAMDADGDFIVAWTGYNGTDADVFIRGFTAGGNNLFGADGQFAANATKPGVQKWSSVAMDVDGDFIVTWTAIGQGDDVGTGNGNILFQRFTAEGGAIGGETQANNRVNRYTTTTQTAIPEAGTIRVPLNVADGLTVLDVDARLNINHPFVGQLQVFLESPAGTRVELVNGAGVPVNTPAANFRNTVFSDEATQSITAGLPPFTGTFRTQNAANPQNPELLSAFDGESAQGTWVLEIIDSTNLIVDSNGSDLNFDGGTVLNWSLDITNNSLVSTTGTLVSTGNQQRPRVASDAQSGFVIVWEDDGVDGDGFAVVGQVFAYSQVGGATGSTRVVDANFIVNQTSLNNQVQPIVATDRRNGDFVVAWASQEQDGDGYGVFARRYNSPASTLSVVPAGNEFQVSSSSSGDQQFPSVAMDADGDFSIVWQGRSDSDIDQDPPEIFMQRYTAAGGERGGEVLVNKTVLSSQQFPSVASTAKGDLIVIWSGNGTDTETLQNDDSGVFGRQFPELNDINGPIVADVIIPDPTVNGRGGPRLTEGKEIAVQENVGLTQLLVTFGENMRVNGSNAARVTNPQNWSLTAGGAGGGGISAVNFGFNSTTQRWEALLTLDRGDPGTPGPDGFLEPGDYMLTLRGAVEDTGGNNLDGTFVGTTGDVGNNFIRRFRIGGTVQARTTETLVNTTTANVQRTEVESPGAVAVDADGDYVVVWTSVGQDGNRDGVYMRRYGANGVPKSGEVLVNTTTDGNQNHATVAVDKDGDIVVTWTGYGQEGDGQTVGNIYARRFRADGTAIDANELRVNTTTLGNQKWSTVAADVRGDFVVTWTSYGQEGNNYGIYAQRYNTAGVAVGNEFRVNETTAGHQQFSSVAMDADGNFIVTWTSFGQDGDAVGSGNVLARRYDAAGNALGGQFLVNTITGGDQRYSRVGADLLGNFVIVWTSTVQDLSGPNIAARRFAADGTPLDTDEFRVNQTADREQQFATVAVDHDGDFTIAWSGFGNVSNPSDDSGVFARRFNTDGTPLPPPAPLEGSSEFPVNNTINGAQQVPSVGATGSGSVVIVWNGNKEGNADGNPQDNQGVVSRSFGVENDDDGPIVTDVLINNVQVLPDIALTELVTQIQVVFGEDLSKISASDLASVLNPNNWVLTRNGTVVVGGVLDGITFSQDANSKKWIATVPVDGNGLGADNPGGLPPALPDGEYVLTVRDFIKDRFNNRLDGNYDGVAGGDFNIRFFLGQDLRAGAEFRTSSTVPGVQQTFPETSQTIAANDNGDFVAVYAGNGVGDDDGIYFQLYGKDGTIIMPSAVLVNQTTVGKQTLPAVAMDGDGDFIVTWTSYGQEGDAATETNVYARAFSAAGLPLTNEFRVNDTSSGSQRWSSPAMSTEGDILISWTDIPRNAVPGEAGNVFFRRFDLGGNSLGDQTKLAFDQLQFPTTDEPLEVLAESTEVATIDVNTAGTIRDINVQLTLTTATAAAAEVTLIAPNNRRVRLIANMPLDPLARENFEGTLFDDEANLSILDGAGPFSGVFRPVDSLDVLDGIPLAGTWSLEVVNRFFNEPNTRSTITLENWQLIIQPELIFRDGREQHSQVAMDATGNFIVVMETTNFESGVNATQGGILAQQFDRSGAASGLPITVNTVATGIQREPAIAVDRRNGDYVVVWTSVGEDGDLDGIFGQRFDARGQALGDQFRVNTSSKGNQSHPSVTMDAQGGFVVTWSGRGDNPNQNDDAGVFAQRFAADGSRRGGEFRVNSSTVGVQQNASIAAGGAGDFIIAWSGSGDRLTQEDRTTNPNELGGTFAQRYKSPLDTAGPIITDVLAIQGESQLINFVNVTGVADPTSFRVQIAGAAGDRVVNFTGLTDIASRAFAVETALLSLVQATPTLGLTDVDVVGLSPRSFRVTLTSSVNNGLPVPAISVNNIAAPNGSTVAAQVGKVRTSTQVRDGGLIESEEGIAQLVVVFGEDVVVSGGAAGLNSVLNPANWTVRPRTLLAAGGVSSVDYRFNPISRKYEAVLTLDADTAPGLQSFLAGEYVLIAAQEIHDLAHNGLDGRRDGSPDSDNDQVSGADFERHFRIRTPAALVNTITENAQRTHIETPRAVAVDGDGDYVVVWTSALQDGSGDGVFMQVFNSLNQKLIRDANGNPVDLLVNAGQTLGSQSQANVALDADGDILVTWTSYGQEGDNTAQGNVYARRFNADGTPARDARTGLPQGIFRVNTTGRGHQRSSSAAIDVDGDFIITWTANEQDGSGDGIFARRYDTQGSPLGSEFQVNTSVANDQRFSTVAMNATGGFIVTWTTFGRAGNLASDGDILARVFDDDGLPVTGEIEVQTAFIGDQRHSRVGSDLFGNFAVTWTSDVRDGSGNNIFARRFFADGTPATDFTTGEIASEFEVNNTRSGNQQYSSVAGTHDGDFIIAWSGNGAEVGQEDTSGVFARRYDVFGRPEVPPTSAGGETEFLVNTTTAGDQQFASIGSDAAGNFVIAWSGSGKQDNQGVYVRKFENESDEVGPIVSDVLAINSDPNRTNDLPIQVTPGAGINATVETLQVIFNEAISQNLGAAGPDSVLNPANWVLLRNGSEITGVIQSISFAQQAATRKWIATLTLDGNGVAAGDPALPDGDYELVARDTLRDLSGNRLDGNFDGAAGFDFQRSFNISRSIQDGGQFLVNSPTATSGTQATGDTERNGAQSVASDDAGNYVVVYAGPGAAAGDANDIYFSLFNADGTVRLRNQRANVITTGEQSDPAVAMDADGDFVISWTDYSDPGRNGDIYYRVFNADGSVFSLQNGGSNGTGGGIKGGTGTAGSPELLASSASRDILELVQKWSTVAMDTDGDFVVGWTGLGQNGDDETEGNIFARTFSKEGVPLSEEVQVNSQAGTVSLPDADLLIPATGDQGTVTSTITVDEGQLNGTTILDINVTVNISHVFDSDLTLTLISPTGTIVTLANRVGGEGNDFLNTTFDDEAARNIDDDDSNPPFIGAFRPQFADRTSNPERLSDFDGETAIGDWQLVVVDNVDNRILDLFGNDTFADNGILNSWSLTITTIGDGFGTADQLPTGNQQKPRAAMDADGNFVVVWEEENNPNSDDGDGFGIRGQLLSSTGSPVGSDFPINTLTSGNQTEPMVAADRRDGNFVVVWSSDIGDNDGSSVFARRFGLGGAATDITEFLVNSTTVGNQLRPSVAMDANDNFVVTWSGNPQPLQATGFDIFAQRYNAQGVRRGTEFVVNTFTAGSQDAAGVASAGAGDFVVVWSGSGAEDADGVYGQRFKVADDGAGPLVADVLFGNERVTDNAILVVGNDGLATLTVTFGEQMFTGADPLSELNIANPANWSLTRNGVGLGGITRVQFGKNATTQKWQAILTLDAAEAEPGQQPFRDGDFVLTLRGTAADVSRDAVTDGAGNLISLAGNGLDGQAIGGGGNPGTDFVRRFRVDDPGVPSAVPTPVGGVLDEREIVVADTLINVLGARINPDAATDRFGNTVVVYQSQDILGASGSNIFLQRFNAAGRPLGEQVLVNSPTGFIAGRPFVDQTNAKVAMDRDGNFVVVWQGGIQLLLDDPNLESEDPNGIYARRFNRFGVPLGDQFRVNELPVQRPDLTPQVTPDVAMNDIGDFVITWSSQEPAAVGAQADADGGVYARCYGRNGQPASAQFRVNTTTNNRQENSAIAMDAAGNFVITWDSNQQDGSLWGIVGQRFNTAGARLGGEFVVNTFTAGFQRNSVVAMDADGDFVVGYTSVDQDGSGYGIYARRYNSAGAAQGAEFRVNNLTQFDQVSPDVGMNDFGDFIFTWQSLGIDGDLNGIAARAFKADGTAPIDPVTGLPILQFVVNETTLGDQRTPSIGVDPVGNFTIGWSRQGLGIGLFSSEIVVQPFRFNPNVTTVAGTAGNDTVVINLSAAGGQIIVNGATTNLSSAGGVFNFDAQAGRDNVTVNAQGLDIDADLWPTTGRIDYGNFVITLAGAEDIAVNAGPGSTVSLSDAATTNDQLVTGPTASTLTGVDPTTLETYSLAARGFTEVVANSTGGADNAVMSDTAANDVVTAGPGVLTLAGSGLTFTVYGFPMVNVVSATGRDQATLADSAGDDLLEAGWDMARLTTGNGSTNPLVTVLSKFATVRVNGSTGFDRARLTDSPGDDSLTLRPDVLTLAGPVAYSFVTQVRGFDDARATAASGNDQANVYDSTGDDNLIMRPGSVLLTGVGFIAGANGFDQVRAFASAGNDTALFYDSAGNDQLVATPTYAQMTMPGYFNYAKGFDYVRALTSTGVDTASLYDSAGDDSLSARSDETVLSGVGFKNTARGFDEVRSYASGGNDRASLYDSAGNDQFLSTANTAHLTGSGFMTYAQGFKSLRAFASAGNDIASIYGTTGADTVIAAPDYTRLTGGSFSVYAQNFPSVSVWSFNAASTATLYDSGGDDTLLARPDNVHLYGAGYSNVVRNFQSVQVIASSGTDTATLDGSTAGGNTATLGPMAPNSALLSSNEQLARLAGPGFDTTASGFDTLQVNALGTNNQATLVDTALNDELRAGGSLAQVRNLLWSSSFQNFSTVRAETLNGGLNTKVVQAVDYILDDDLWT